MKWEFQVRREVCGAVEVVASYDVSNPRGAGERLKLLRKHFPGLKCWVELVELTDGACLPPNGEADVGQRSVDWLADEEARGGDNPFLRPHDFVKIEAGPFGTRWSYVHDEEEIPPSVAEAEIVLGVKLAPRTADASAEREDGLCETVYFLDGEYDKNTVATYSCQ